MNADALTEVSSAENLKALPDQREAGAEQGPPELLPIIPLRETVVFPGTVMPIGISRDATLRLLEENLPQSRWVGVLAQKDGQVEDPTPDDLYRVGVRGLVSKYLRQPEGGVVVLFQGQERVRVQELRPQDGYLKARVEVLKESVPSADDDYWQAAVRNLRDSALKLLEMNPSVPDQAKMALANIEDPVLLTDFLAGNLSLETKQKQALLEETDVNQRLQSIQQHINNQIHIAELQKKIAEDVATEFSDSQRRAYLREQMRAIQKELGEADSAEAQIDDLRTRLESAGLPENVMAHAEKELQRLAIIPAASPEHGMIVSYLEILAELPWSKLSEDNLDLDRARQILDRDHYGLEKIKQRLIEYLAVRKLKPAGRGPILCFTGPPGVGKTSLGQSIADALGREFVRVSLGGIRDEAEIRGHRRTYIGSMPGRIIQELRRCGTRNPVFMLDEVDKIGADFRGDPSSALLEVLDPRQNNTFSDRYLDVPFDLSQVLFIATGNYLEAIPPPLRDRMEVIQLSGYTPDEKLQIAKRYLVRRQLEENGLEGVDVEWKDEALAAIIESYTREAGVRELERQIGSVCRGIAAEVAREREKQWVVTPEFAREKLGAAKHVREEYLRTSQPGVVNGLAYTPVGGEVLHIEAIRYEGKGRIQLTGQLGNVMKESAQAALSLARSRAVELGIHAKDFNTFDVHIHVPAGAIPKDGPSAGVAMFTAVASLFADRPVDHEVAMTGEISLRGLVLPIGGLKEKTLAALRGGIKKVLIPELNMKDVPELPEEVREKLQIVPVANVDDVLNAALKEEPVPVA